MIIFTGHSNSQYAYVLASVFGIYVGITETLQRAVIPRYVSSELRGIAYGIYNLVLAHLSLLVILYLDIYEIISI